MYLMLMISVERFWIVYKPMLARNMKLSTRLYAVLMCFVLSVMWSSMPLLGWSRYSLESCGTSCSIEWAERSASVTSYNVAIFLFVFLLPLMLLVYLNVQLVVIINQFYHNKKAASIVKRQPVADKNDRTLNTAKINDGNSNHQQQEQQEQHNDKNRSSVQQGLTSPVAKLTVIFIAYIGILCSFIHFLTIFKQLQSNLVNLCSFLSNICFRVDAIRTRLVLLGIRGAERSRTHVQSVAGNVCQVVVAMVVALLHDHQLHFQKEELE